MSNIAQQISDLEELAAHYLLAEKAALKGQSYTIGNRTLTRPDLEFISKERTRINNKICQLKERGNNVGTRHVVFNDYQ